MCKHIFWHFFEKFSVLAGGQRPLDPPAFGWGGKAPPDPPLKRSFVTFDRGGQTGPPRSNDSFFGTADDTRAARTSGRTFGRTPAGRPLTTRPNKSIQTRRYCLVLILGFVFACRVFFCRRPNIKFGSQQ